MDEIFELAKVYRADAVESIHYGIAVLTNRSGIKQAWGDADSSCYTRSIIKPIQTKVSQELLAVKLSSIELAMATASHHAEPGQLEQIKALMSKFNIAESDLHCGLYFSPHHKLDSPIKHNCSAKHTLMIAACKKQEWDIQNYYSLQHPLQQAVINELIRLYGDNSTDEAALIGSKTAIDGCGVPTFYLSLKQMARIFTNMLSDPAYQLIIQAMRDYPLLIGGAKQIDSLLMQKSSNLIAKGGAEGLMMIANLHEHEVLVIKIIDGSSRAKAVISLALAEALGWVEKDLIRVDNAIYNSRNDIVGHIQASI
jgi:L-asparaginase II